MTWRTPRRGREQLNATVTSYVSTEVLLTCIEIRVNPRRRSSVNGRRQLRRIRQQEALQFGGLRLRQAVPAVLQVSTGHVEEQHEGAELAGDVDPAGMGAPAVGVGE